MYSKVTWPPIFHYDFAVTFLFFVAFIFTISFYPLLLYTLHENCPFSELFWSAFSHICTESGEILRISLCSVRRQENTDRNNSEYRHFLRNDILVLISGILLFLLDRSLHKKWSFPSGLSSVNVTESARNCRFGHIY